MLPESRRTVSDMKMKCREREQHMYRRILEDKEK